MRRTVPNRRGFLGGLVAAGMLAPPTWADAGAPAYLSAGARRDGSFVLCGIGADLTVRFEIALPARGHAAAAHPSRPDAVAFARRPGTFALVIDCAAGVQKAILTAPEGRHFYGHGVFSRDGNWLFTTENDYDAGRGVVGVWDAHAGYRRTDEFPSGGIGPHDMKRLPGSDTLVVANGGIDTHPDSGRAKLNLHEMAPNLAYLRAGQVVEVADLAPAHHKASLRHLDVARDGRVAVGVQWQGDANAPFVMALHRLGERFALPKLSAPQHRGMQGYVGSITFSGDETQVIATSPKGGLVQVYDVASLSLTQQIVLRDVCGVAPAQGGAILSSGSGMLADLPGGPRRLRNATVLQWDNHLIAV